MTREEKQAEVMKKVADTIDDSDLSVAEKVGVLTILQTSYIFTAASNQ
jgi:hypothetical protein